MKNITFIILFLFSLSILLSSCFRNSPTPTQVKISPEPISNSGFTILGIIELGLTSLGSSDFDVTAINLDASEANLNQQALGEIGNGIKGRILSKDFFDYDGYRYYSVTVEIRNADKDGTAYTTERQNLSFLPLGIGHADTAAYGMYVSFRWYRL